MASVMTPKAMKDPQKKIQIAGWVSMSSFGDVPDSLALKRLHLDMIKQSTLKTQGIEFNGECHISKLPEAVIGTLEKTIDCM